MNAVLATETPHYLSSFNHETIFYIIQGKNRICFFGCVCGGGVFLCSLESPLLFELANLMMLLHISEQALFLLQTENQAV